MNSLPGIGIVSGQLDGLIPEITWREKTDDIKISLPGCLDFKLFGKTLLVANRKFELFWANPLRRCGVRAEQTLARSFCCFRGLPRSKLWFLPKSSSSGGGGAHHGLFGEDTKTHTHTYTVGGFLYVYVETCLVYRYGYVFAKVMHVMYVLICLITCTVMHAFKNVRSVSQAVN